MELVKLIARIKALAPDDYVTIGFEVGQHHNGQIVMEWNCYIAQVGTESFSSFEELELYVELACRKLANKTDLADEIKQGWEQAKELQKEGSYGK